MKAISRKLVSDWKEAQSEAGRLKSEIIDRIYYIVETWFALYGAKLECCYFDCASENEFGDLDRNMDEDVVSNLYTECKNFPDDNELAFINKYGDEYSWQGEIPTRWLYDDSFKDEIIQGKAKYLQLEEERLAKKKQALSNKKVKDKKLVDDAIKKLSKDELAALKEIYQNRFDSFKNN
jgi:hypothetical protein